MTNVWHKIKEIIIIMTMDLVVHMDVEETEDIKTDNIDLELM